MYAAINVCILKESIATPTEYIVSALPNSNNNNKNKQIQVRGGSRKYLLVIFFQLASDCLLVEVTYPTPFFHLSVASVFSNFGLFFLRCNNFWFSESFRDAIDFGM